MTAAAPPAKGKKRRRFPLTLSLMVPADFGRRIDAVAERKGDTSRRMDARGVDGGAGRRGAEGGEGPARRRGAAMIGPVAAFGMVCALAGALLLLASAIEADRRRERSDRVRQWPRCLPRNTYHGKA